MSNQPKRATVLLFGFMLSSQAWCQYRPPALSTPTSLPSASPVEQVQEGAKHQAVFTELDLLRRHDFERAAQVTVSLRVTDNHGNRILNLGAGDFRLTINGTLRQARLLDRSTLTKSMAPPYVLLVFPPNQPEIHYLAVQQCLRYFCSKADEKMNWKVGIFDANGTFSAFTDKRSELIANITAVGTAKEPIQLADPNFATPGKSWQGAWLDKVNAAVSEMQRQPGPRLIMAMNPFSEPFYSVANPSLISNNGPVDLMPIASRVGAQIYIANVGGPDAIVPEGDAAGPNSVANYIPNMQQLNGTTPSSHQRINPAQTAALAHAAAYTSQMQQVAGDTLGGFSNSVATLAGKMQQDLDSAYQLQFDMTPEDQDRGFHKSTCSCSRRIYMLRCWILNP
jgi:hypothetical protein